MNSILKELLEYAIIIVVVVLVRIFIVAPAKVDGESMYPTLDDGELLIMKKYDHKLLVKRVIGLPGENINYENNNLYVNGIKVDENFDHAKTSDFNISKLGVTNIPDDMYFVLGDNRINSVDSRMIGLIKKEDIVGTTNFAFFPINKFGVIEHEGS